MNIVAPRSDTKQRILDSAERLFADHGFEGTSLRTIIADAKVNLAAIHYHYHSKEALLDAVILRRLEPINLQRLAMLDECERASAGHPSLEGVLEAFVAPPFRAGIGPGGVKSFAMLMGRIFTEQKSGFPQVIKQHLVEVVDRFKSALHNAAPELPIGELFWRLHFVAGAMAHTLRCGQDLEMFSEGHCDTSDVEGTIRRLVQFGAAGFRAPAGQGGDRV
jgi:AcrR family transcriptional regulator